MKMMNTLAAVIFAAALPCAALAQTSPNLTYKQVLTPGQWNVILAGKQDVLNFTPLNSSGGVMLGRLVTAPPSSTTAGLNLTPGTAPGSPVNGDIWVTSAGFFGQVNGTTLPLTGASSGSFAGTSPITVSFPSGVVTYACATCGLTGNPLSQFASTTSAQLAGVISNETGTGLLVFNTSPSFVTPALGVATGTSLALGGCSIGSSVFCAAGISNFNGPTVVTGASSTALSVGLNGVSNPAFQVNTATASQATGILITAAAAGGGVTLSAISSGSNESLTINSKGSQILFLNNVASGQTQIGGGGGGVDLLSALTYGGITLNNAVTGTGNMVLSSGPTITLGNATGLPLGTGVTGNLALANIATGTQDTVLGYFGSTSVSAIAPGNCSNALTYSTSTHSFGCNTTAGTGTVTVSGTPTAGMFAQWTTATNIQGISPAPITNSLAADVNLTSTSTYFDGPSIAQGSTGTWWASGTVTLNDTAASSFFNCKLWDGTTVIDSGRTVNLASNNLVTMSLSGSISSPAANIRISCEDSSATTGKIIFNGSGNSKDSTVSAHRIQ